jgi:hypothetical protein
MNTMNIRLFFLNIAVTCHFGADALHSQQNRVEIEGKVLSGWKQLEAMDLKIQAIDYATKQINAGGRNPGNVSISGKYRTFEGDALVSGTKDTGRTEDVIVNSKYISLISRDSNNPSWNLRLVELDPQNIHTIKKSAFSKTATLPSSSLPLGAMPDQNLTPTEISGDSHFKMTKIETLSDSMILIHFQYKLLTGELICDSSANYLAVRGKSQIKDARSKLDFHFERQYQKNNALDSEYPQVRQLIFESKTEPDNESVSVETNYSYPAFNKSELFKERFRLSFYGIPEPENIFWEKNGNFIPYYIAISGLIIVLLTTWLLRKMRSPIQEKS